MTVGEMAKAAGLRCVSGAGGLENEIKGGYSGDLLSWVMAKAEAGNVWITIQGHINAIAVASLTGVSAVILAEGSEPSEDMLMRSEEENIPVLLSEESCFCLSVKLAALGV